jgi:chitodextrinase
VIDDGSDGQYAKGAGTIFLIDGTGGESLSSVSASSAEAPYFARLNGSTYGFTSYSVTRDRIDSRFVNSSGSFTDAFSISGGSSPPPPPPPTDTTPPTAPMNLIATTTTPDRVDLSWTAATDDVEVAGYRVFRNATQIATTTSTSYADTTVSSNTTYTYEVRAYDAAGNVSQPSNTATVTTAIVLTFAPTADAYVAGDAASTNFGSATRLEVDSSPLRNTLMTFSPSGIAGRRILSCKLRLYNVDSSGKGGDFYRVADTSWQEGAVTWNTAPAADPSPFASLGKVTAGSWYEVNLLPIVAGDGTVSLKITSSSRNGAAYDSREGSAAFRPQLIITVAPS